MRAHGLDAAGLAGGDYDASVRVQSNDPHTPVVAVPVNLHVTGAPDIQLSKTSIDFGTRFLGATTLDTLTFVGTALLLGAVAAGSAALPALRATRVDPNVALRAN